MPEQALRSLVLDRASSVPLYRQIKDAVLERIEDERLAPGDRLTPEIELSKALGVSQITVIQALRELVKEGYLSRHRGKGTFVSRTLRRTVTVIMSDVGSLTHQFLTQTMMGIEHEVKRNRCTLHVLMVHDNSLDEAGGRALTQASMKEGLIVCPPLSPEEIRRLQEDGVPFVVLSSEYRGLDPPTVVSDDWSVGRAMGEFLLRKKCRAIGSIIGRRQTEGTPRRHMADRLFAGLEEAMGAEFGRVQDRYLLPTDYRRDTAEKLTAQLLAMRPPPDAIILFGDNAIEGAVSVVTGKGMKLGKDIVLVGYRDTPRADAFPVPTLGHPLYRMGQELVRLLGKVVAGQQMKTRRVVVKAILDRLA